MPITFSRGSPVIRNATSHIASRGFETMMKIASREWRNASLTTPPTISVFLWSRSSRDIPGFRASPAVTTTMSEFAVIS